MSLLRDSLFGSFLRVLGCKAEFLLHPENRSDFVLPKSFASETPIPEKVYSLSADSDATVCHDSSLVVDWYSDQDAENPQNWDGRRKAIVTAIIVLQNFAAYTGSALYTPSIPGVQEDFGVSETKAVLGLSVFILGYSSGPLFFSPLSEIPAIGRNHIYFWTMLTFMIFQIPSLFATNMSTLLAMRFLTGFFGSPSLAMGGGSVADIWSGKHVPYMLAIWDMGAICGPVLGPILGGFAADAHGWRWPLYILSWITAFTIVVMFFFLPETQASTILLRRAERLRKLTGDKRIRSESEIEQSKLSWSTIVSDSLLRPFQMMLEPEIAYMDIYVGFVYAIFYLWFEAFPLVFVDMHHFNLGELGLAYLGLAIGMVFYLFAYFAFLYYWFNPQYESGAKEPKAEDLLLIALAGVPFVPISLFVFGWTSKPSIHWIAPIIGSAIYAPGIESIFLGVFSYLAAAYPKYSASVFAGNAFVRGGIAAAFPLFGDSMYKSLGVGPGCSMLAGISILAAPGFWILYKIGPRLRAKSKFAAVSPQPTPCDSVVELDSTKTNEIA